MPFVCLFDRKCCRSFTKSLTHTSTLRRAPSSGQSPKRWMKSHSFSTKHPFLDLLHSVFTQCCSLLALIACIARECNLLLQTYFCGLCVWHNGEPCRKTAKAIKMTRCRLKPWRADSCCPKKPSNPT